MKLLKPASPNRSQGYGSLPSFSVLIVTGLSGSGKSTVLHALEDVGFFCIDNLPLSLLAPFLEEISKSRRDRRNVALVMDVRTEGFLQNYVQVFKELEAQGYFLRILFLEADEDALIRRFSQTRRQHPLADHDSVSHALRQERESLKGLREMAHRIIDTTSFNPHQLRKLIIAEYTDLSPERRMALHLTSFAYKNGIPPEADLVIDVRFLPNPHFIDELRPFTGNEPRVREFVLKHGETRAFITHLFDFVDFLLPLYQKEGKTHLNIAIGCTGGQHRSVVIANCLGEHLAQKKFSFSLTHRDLAEQRGE
ncbi:MAG: RNase adapter RapZ [Deltaproteobacteria bacterium]|nr:RNase adapter RapZ [Deltaproteobacteria bacterium]